MGRALKFSILWSCLFLALQSYFVFVAPVFINGNKGIAISDYYYQLVVAKQSVRDFFDQTIEHPLGPYNPVTHFRGLSSEFPDHQFRVMPVALNPLGYLLIFVPFFSTPAATAQAFFIAVSLTVLWLVLSKYYGPRNILFILLIGGAIFSKIGLCAIQLGQTTFIAVAAFLLLLRERQEKHDTFLDKFLDLCALVMLSVKSTYLALGILLLLGLRQWKSVAVAVIINCVAMLSFTLFFGSQWFSDYANNLGQFVNLDLPANYRWAVNLDFITTLVGLLGPRAVQVSKILYGLFLVPTVLLAANGTLGCIWKAREQNKIAAFTPEVGFLYALTGYLCFLTYLGRHEDFLLVIPLVLCFRRECMQNEVTSLTSKNRLTIEIGLCLLLILLNLSAYQESLSFSERSIFFALKVCYLLYFVVVFLRREAKSKLENARL